MSAAQDLTRALRGSWLGYYGTARCPAHDDQSPSLSIGIGTRGQLLLKCHAGCSFDAIRAALALRDGQLDYVKDRGDVVAARLATIRRAKRSSRQARAIWEQGLPINGTPAERYLRNRGITCVLPPMLRYAPMCWHLTAKRLPALLCNVSLDKGAAIHRTYIAADGLCKAPVTPAKAMLGQTRGGAVRLCYGMDGLVVAEGLETTLSLMSGIYPGNHSYWAALSASGMAGLTLPGQPGRLVIAPDGDKVGLEAAQKLANRAYNLGWQVSLYPAPDGQDWNDILVARGVAP